MAKVKLGSNATFLGPQKGLAIVSDWCYAYRGEHSVAGSLVTVLEFQTGKRVTVLKYLPIYFTNNSEDFIYSVLLNGNTVLANILNDHDNQPFTSEQIVVPPNTLVQVTIIASGHSSTRTVGALMTGRIYDA